jgi:hypothetical protein
MQIPTHQQAVRYLAEAQGMNPGPWVDHSHHVAQSAANIAQKNPSLEHDTAYILGLLHDIGRREGVYGMRHVIDGYNFMRGEGYSHVAQISLTHSYPIPQVMHGSSEWDGTENEQQFVADYLANHPYSDYDRLIQLCDSICMPGGPVLMEKRFIDVTMRYGFNRYTTEKWRAFINIKATVEAAIGHSIYECLDGVVENTFSIL